MKRYLIWIGIAIIVVILVVIAIFSKKGNTNNTDNQNTNNLSHNTTSFYHNEESIKTENEIINSIENHNEIVQPITNETEISSYATTIKDKEAGRLTNISITCSTLNNTIIHPNETFSFNAIVGKPTPERGYQEASVIIDHKTERGIRWWKLSSK